jgi:glutamyl-tRNA synthetase
MTDDGGVRLAKRHDALSLRTLRERGESPDSLIRSFSATE